MTFTARGPFSLDMDFLYDGMPQEMVGKKTTISELEKMFPNEEIILMKDKNFLVFGIENSKKKIYRYLAHECIHCNELIIGAPEKKYFNTFKEKQALSGSAGHSYYCKLCDGNLGIDFDVIA
jgi:hypothetical protein